VSQERKRAREARDAARRRHLETAASARARQARRAEVRDRLRPSLPRRRRRFGQLSTRALAQVVGLYLAVQAVFWWFVPDLATRIALAVISLAFLAVLVRTRKRPAR
jgi:Flp pilus assembly protein TadB